MIFLSLMISFLPQKVTPRTVKADDILICFTNSMKLKIAKYTTNTKHASILIYIMISIQN